MHSSSRELRALVIGLISAVATPLAGAADGAGDNNEPSDGMSVSFDGFIRSETAVKSSSSENPFNQRSNVMNGRTVNRSSAAIGGFSDTATRNGGRASNDLDLLLFRAELNLELKFTPNLSLVSKLRAVFDPGWYDEFEPAGVNSIAVGSQYGEPNYFEYFVEGKSQPNPLEFAGRNYLIGLPSFFVAYDNGPFNLRVGNQQIAWGQAVFFRVLDVVDGLDLRRHSVLDFASEEFADKRVPALGVRASYQISPDWLVDGYVQKFQPTVYPNANTPYNVIASQFTVHDLYDEYDSKVSYGLRLKGQAGKVGLQAIAVRRYNPDGVFRWTESGVNRDLALVPGSGAAMQGTPFEVDPSGVWSATEWFNYAGLARLSGVTAFDSAASFPAALALGAVPTSMIGLDPYDPAAKALVGQQLDLFFQLSGSGLRGHLAREYRPETLVGGGISYVTEGAPGSWLDQLVINVEALYARDRVFTDPSLSGSFHRDDEVVAALVLEKYQRFSENFPATYLVFQWLHKTRSDLFGRLLDGYGGDENTIGRGVSGGYNAFAIVAQQAFPNLVWRADLAVLYEGSGGVLIQPAVRWKPNDKFTLEAYYNFLSGSFGNESKNALSTVAHADELTIRLGWQF
ncbi:MAG: DUF1302 domain-containing protein [Gammaproteobacteria bacterium]|nr:DUF1302 domain-containing protein [Gammaproteobacteria bacterium]